MRIPANERRARTLLALCLLLSPASDLAAQAPDPSTANPPRSELETFSSQVEVTAVELMIDVRDAEGRRPDDLRPEDFEVFEDDAPMRVIGIEYPTSAAADGRSPELRRAAPPSPPAAQPMDADVAPEEPEEVIPFAGQWKIVVYIDRPLSARQTIYRIGRALAKNARRLTELGAVEVVLADPRPRVVLPFTRDPERVKKTLSELARTTPGQDQMARLRGHFLRDREITGSDPSRLSGDRAALEQSRLTHQSLNLVQQEWMVCQHQLASMRNWMSTYPSGAANAIFLVSDGFDLNPQEFFEKAAWLDTSQDDLGEHLQHFRFAAAIQEVSQTLAARGWNTISLAPEGIRRTSSMDVSNRGSERYRAFMTSSGQRGQGAGAALRNGIYDRTANRQRQSLIDPGSAESTFLLSDPLAPLRLAAEETGGEVYSDAGKTHLAIEGLHERLRLTYVASRPADGQRHRLKVRSRRPELTIRATRWIRSPTPAQVSEDRARRALIAAPQGGDLPFRATLQFVSSEPAEDGTVDAKLRLLVDLSSLRLEPGQSYPLRLTMAIAIPGRPTVVQQLEARVTDPSSADEEMPPFHLILPFRTAPETSDISVVVEEMESGIWGTQRTSDAGVPEQSADG